MKTYLTLAILLALCSQVHAVDLTLEDINLRTNNTWMLVATFMVFIMHLGFATLETGLTRSKNTVNILFKNTGVLAIGLITYAICGFNLMYPGFIDGQDPAAVAEAGGAGFEVFGFTGWGIAGSTLVHSVGGWAALAGVVMLGPRIGKYVNGTVKPIMGHNLPLAAVGVFLFWFGWYGFNGGSVLSADAELVSKVFVTTSLSAAAGVLSAIAISWVHSRKPDLTMP